MGGMERGKLFSEVKLKYHHRKQASATKTILVALFKLLACFEACIDVKMLTK